MLQSCYAEYLVHRKNTVSGMILKCLMISVLIISLLGFLGFLGGSGSTVSIISFIIMVVDVVLMIYIFPRFKVDWEYVFVDGQLDFDQILGGNARKNKDRIDFEKMEVVAPTGSYHLDNFKHVQMKTLDYSSLTGNNTYTIICHKGNEIIRILFEPDANMVSTMKQKSPRKVFND